MAALVAGVLASSWLASCGARGTTKVSTKICRKKQELEKQWGQRPLQGSGIGSYDLGMMCDLLWMNQSYPWALRLMGWARVGGMMRRKPFTREHAAAAFKKPPPGGGVNC